jgi:tetratricopeptide (TPR) repeat protein
VNLGLLALSLGEFDQAEAAYKKALELDSGFVNAYVNLADLYRILRQNMKAEKVLRQALLKTTEHATIYHSLGLYYVRNDQNVNALEALGKAHDLVPENIRYAYVYAVALKEQGQVNKSLAVLTSAHKADGANLEVLFALVSFYLVEDDRSNASLYAQKLVDINPQYGSVQQLIQNLQQQQ